MEARDEFLPPELLEGLGDLEWVGKMVARGLGSGIHRSPLVGRGEEFDRHQPYQQGDDLRHLDWRLMARFDRLYVRRFRESTSVPTILVVDASPSMDFPPKTGESASGWASSLSKLRYAALVAAALGHLAREGGDIPGLAVSGGTEGAPQILLPPRPGKERWRAVLYALDALAPGVPASLAPLIRQVGEAVRAGGRVVILSDFLEEDGGRAVVREAGALRARGDEVFAIRILTPEELGEGRSKDALYQDPEDPSVAVPGSPSGDPGYRERLQAYYGALARSLEDRGVTWWEAGTTDPLLPLIRGWIRGEGSGLHGGSRLGLDLPLPRGAGRRRS